MPEPTPIPPIPDPPKDVGLRRPDELDAWHAVWPRAVLLRPDFDAERDAVPLALLTSEWAAYVRYRRWRDPAGREVAAEALDRCSRLAHALKLAETEVELEALFV